MSTDLLPVGPRDQDGTRAVILEPGTGLELDLGRPAGDLVAARDRLAKLREEASAVERLITRELAYRIDATGKRTVEVDGVKLKANAPTEDLYRLTELVADLEAHGYAEQAKAVQRQPPTPKPPPPALDARALAGLLRSDDRRLLGIIARHRTRQGTTRKVDVVSRAVDSTAEEA